MKIAVLALCLTLCTGLAEAFPAVGQCFQPKDRQSLPKDVQVPVIWQIIIVHKKWAQAEILMFNGAGLGWAFRQTPEFFRDKALPITCPPRAMTVPEINEILRRKSL